MNNISLNDFNNICRTCMNYCDIKYFKDSVISNVFYKLTEIHFETNNELPQQICLKCFQKINEIHEFSFQCKRVHFDLLSLQKLKNPGNNIKQELLEETNDSIKIEEITIDEHKHEFFKDEILNSRSEYVIDELKVGKVETNISEEIIPETKDQNVNCSEDDLSETNAPDITKQIEEETNDPVNSNVSDKNTNSSNKCDELNIECAEEDKDRLKKTEEKHKCEVCNKSFMYIKKLEKHRSLQICNRSFKCEQCSRVFNAANNFKRHMRTHTGERLFKCKLCSNSYSHNSTLKEHMRTHTDERPFKCERCSISYSHSGSLRNHMRMHSGERPYKCDHCLKTFAQSSYLKTHMRIHTGECPFKCEQCLKMFKYSNSLIAHMRTHTT